MTKINKNYEKLPESYLFAEISRRVAKFQKENPEAGLIRMGIGDVTLPLSGVVVDAMKNAAEEQRSAETFRGYGPEQGYDFLRQAVGQYYAEFGVKLAIEDIFIGDGAKSDVANITDIFDADNTVLVPNPVYPVYLDTNIMNGRRIKYMQGTAENGFLPPPPDFAADIIYLCSPNNPTGACYTRQDLRAWVDYALANSAVILYDAAYEAFIEDGNLPRSIFEIEGAEKCAIEFCSLSKTAGFTGTRCSYTVVPSTLILGGKSLRSLWLRRQTTKFNGVPYVVQRGAEAALSPAGMAECRKNIAYYKQNAAIVKEGLQKQGISSIGGENSPYIWFACPKGMRSWDFFDYLLQKAAVVVTPGAGFGEQGEGFVRISSFAMRENVIEAMQRMEKVLVELAK